MYKPEIAAEFYFVFALMYQNLLLYLVSRVNVSDLHHGVSKSVLVVEQRYF